MKQTTQTSAKLIYKFSFMGRKVGAIGNTEYITAERIAEDEETARIALYGEFEHIEVIKVTCRNLKAKYWVTMTDKFMSGWGCAGGKTNKLVIACDNIDEALLIEKNAHKRNEMKYINICRKYPYYNGRTTLVSDKHFTDMGGMWIE